MNTISKKIDSLQGLRAFAAISVMLFHGTEVLHDKADYVFLNNFFMAGFSGVQLFFVLSGFIIFYTSYEKGLSVKGFLTKRFVRIYPVHTLVILSLVAFYFISPSPDQAYRGRIGAITSSLTLIPFDTMVLGPSWTLCFEVMFYLLFAVTFLSNKKIFYLAIGFWTVLIITALEFNFKTGLTVIDNFCDLMNLNFIFGCLIALLYIEFPIIRYSEWFILPAAVIFTFFWVLQVRGLLNDEPLTRALCFGLPSAMLVTGLLYCKSKTPRLLIHLGDASFSLYLLHFPLVRILLKVFLKLGVNRHLNNFAMSVIIFIFIILISSLFYLFVEHNILNFFNAYIKSRKNKEQIQESAIL